jgi:membrane protein implicated in regulation of membrane protease activity
MTHSITWADFFLICFAMGFCSSFFSFVLGGARIGKIHLPHVHTHVATHMPCPGAPGAATPQLGARTPSAHAVQSGGVSPFNFVSLMAFLAWFGGAGFLLTRYSGLWIGFGLLISVFFGLIGGGVVFLFLSRVLIRPDESMDPADYEMVGVLGHVSSPIRPGGTGEIVYSQMGTRRVCGARCEDGGPIAKGTEVVVTRYEKGIVYVRPWSEISGEETSQPTDKTADKEQSQ